MHGKHRARTAGAGRRSSCRGRSRLPRAGEDPRAVPARTDGALHYLGYRAARAGVTLGPKARDRMRERLKAAASGPPERLLAALAAYRAVWMFASLHS